MDYGADQSRVHKYRDLIGIHEVSAGLHLELYHKDQDSTSVEIRRAHRVEETSIPKNIGGDPNLRFENARPSAS